MCGKEPAFATRPRGTAHLATAHPDPHSRASPNYIAHGRAICRGVASPTHVGLMRNLGLLGFLLGIVSVSVALTDISAQATINAGVRGTVVDSSDNPISDAAVLSLNLSNGERWQTTTDSRGRYYPKTFPSGDLIALRYGLSGTRRRHEATSFSPWGSAIRRTSPLPLSLSNSRKSPLLPPRTPESTPAGPVLP
jgi:hypothetical protein